jgi:uncharacterized membrane protein YdjX (TVP38/TMEM64 family)
MEGASMGSVGTYRWRWCAIGVIVCVVALIFYSLSGAKTAFLPWTATNFSTNVFSVFIAVVSLGLIGYIAGAWRDWRESREIHKLMRQLENDILPPEYR